MNKNLFTFPRGQYTKLPCAWPNQIGRVPGTGERGVVISVFTLQAGEERVVAERIAAILRQAAAR